MGTTPNSLSRSRSLHSHPLTPPPTPSRTRQAAALSCFNDHETMSYNELLTKLNIMPEILKPIMHSLCCGKHKILKKDPANNKIKEEDSFTPNAKFSSPNMKLKIPMASLDSNVNVKKIEEDRCACRAKRGHGKGSDVVLW